ncbi:MAG: cysteine desulfurase [Gammaproteobacteria bacterium]
MAVTETAVAHTVINPQRLRADFPALAQNVRGHPLIYLDNAATTQKPQTVIDAEANYYHHDNANVHRGVHTLSERATEQYERARARIAQFIGAGSSEEIVFTRGTTEAINLVAGAWGPAHIAEGDEILLTELEHHSNIVPWQLLAERTGARIVVAPIDERGNVPLESFTERLSERTRLVALAHVSNALGTVNPVAEMIRRAHQAGARVLVDGAQAVGHLPVNVRDLDCDFYALSGHKMYAPMGIGALYVREEIAADMAPWQGGGDMIRAVRFDKTLYAEPPYRFEAGTPNVGGAIGLAAAIDYLVPLGMAALAEAEDAVLLYALTRLRDVPGLRLIGEPDQRVGVISFEVDGVHPHDLGTLLDHAGVAIRTGHHCAMPVMEHYGVPATARASFGLYNTSEDVDILVAALIKAREVFCR